MKTISDLLSYIIVAFAWGRNTVPSCPGEIVLPSRPDSRVPMAGTNASEDVCTRSS
jgi:hypothetical protein